MKKLVKTAKQQFEERLGELTLIKKYSMIETDLYYLCENSANDMCILREIHGTEFYEQRYNCSYLNLISGEEFLRAITFRFIDHYEIDVKPLFDWYASADKDNEPFTLDDIWMCNLEDEDLSVVYHDIYEEVPDVRIITADEQFESRLKDVGLIQDWTLQGSLGRIGWIDNETKRIHIFVHEDKHDAYTEFVYPPFEELRKDSQFCLECLGDLADNCDDSFFKEVSLWIHFGGNCPLDPVDVYFSANHLRLKETVDFEDKELHQEQVIDKKDFSSEITDLKERMIKHLSDLYNQGMKVDFDWMCVNMHTVGWGDGSFDYIDSIEHFDVFMKDVPYVKFVTEHSKDTFETRLINLTIESIWSIINAMR